MNYETKLKESMRRVYSCNYSQKREKISNLRNTINRNVEKSNEKPKFDMNEDVDNLILIAVGYLGLSSYMADRTKQILFNMWSHPDNFHDIKYENAVLGILMHVVYEVLDESVTVDFNKYCTYLFGTKEAERNITQMYKAYLNVCDLYKQVEQELQLEQ